MEMITYDIMLLFLSYGLRIIVQWLCYGKENQSPKSIQEPRVFEF